MVWKLTNRGTYLPSKFPQYVILIHKRWLPATARSYHGRSNIHFPAHTSRHDLRFNHATGGAIAGRECATTTYASVSKPWLALLRATHSCEGAFARLFFIHRPWTIAHVRRSPVGGKPTLFQYLRYASYVSMFLHHREGAYPPGNWTWGPPCGTFFGVP